MVLVNQICLIIKIYSCPKFLVDTHDSDYSFEDRIKILQEEETLYNKRQQEIKDSIENERIEKARKEAEDKKRQLLSTEGAQI